MKRIDILPKQIFKFHYDDNSRFDEFINQNLKSSFPHKASIFSSYPESQIISQENLPKNLFDFISNSVEEVLFDEKILYEQFQYNLFWLNYHVNRTKSSHTFHTHQNSIFSGVYYFMSLNKDKLTFKDSDHEYRKYHDIFRADGSPYRIMNQDVPVSAGDLLIFRSDYEHGLEEFTVSEGETRISLSFNIELKGIGSKNRLTIR